MYSNHMDTTNNEAWVNGDRVSIAAGPFATGEQARQAMADGNVVPLRGLDLIGLSKACVAAEANIEFVNVTVFAERVTGQETDSERLVEKFVGVRELALTGSARVARDVLMSHMAEMIRRVA